jgi:hypothetical protein
LPRRLGGGERYYGCRVRGDEEIPRQPLRPVYLPRGGQGCPSFILFPPGNASLKSVVPDKPEQIFSPPSINELHPLLIQGGAEVSLKLG